MRYFTVVIFAAAFSFGCLPMVAKHYLPSSEAGELIYSRCFGQTHIPRGVRFARNGTRIETALVRHRDNLYLQLLITPAESNRVQLHEHAARVYVGESTQGRAAAFDSISLVNPIYLEVPNTGTIQIDKPMIGEKRRLGNFDYDKNYWLTTKLEVFEAELIRVVLPEFVLNGESVIFPAIQFKNEWIAGLKPFNC
jgi:hypothetical protein